MKLNIFKKKKEVVSPPKKEIKENKIKKEISLQKAENRAGRKIDYVYKILVRPLITEKSSFIGQYNQYAFEVNPKANKIEIAKAIESVYGVKPLSVNIIKVKGKKVRYGKITGKTKNWKKALITLKQGEKISVYEGGKE